MSKYEFEAKVPVACVKHVIEIVRSGELKTRKGELLQECGAILGESGALLSTFENPDVFAGDTSEIQSKGLNELVDEIEEFVEAYDEQLNQINPIFITLLIELIKRLIEQI